jgi:serine/threonine-protein kinase ATR
MRWLQTTKAKYGDTGVHVKRYGQMQILLDAIHPELISQRAVYCKQYSLALFHLEPYYRREGSERRLTPDEQQGLLQSIQDIYAQIDDPDGLEGMIATVANVDIDQMILSHRKAGRWEATQTWYEIRLAKDPDNLDVQLDLLTCLKESGQHGELNPPVIV